MCLQLCEATRALCPLGFLQGRHKGFKGSIIYRMADRMPYLHTWGKLIFFQRQALGKTNYINLFFSNIGVYVSLGKARRYRRGQQRSLSACQSCGYQQTGAQVWGGGGRCQSSPCGGKLCWWGQLQSALNSSVQYRVFSHLMWHDPVAIVPGPLDRVLFCQGSLEV